MKLSPETAVERALQRLKTDVSIEDNFLGKLYGFEG